MLDKDNHAPIRNWALCSELISMMTGAKSVWRPKTNTYLKVTGVAVN